MKLDYDLICKATQGNHQALNDVLRYYDHYIGPAEKSDSRYGRSFKQLLVLSQPILQSNLRSSARAKKELKGSAAGAQRSLPG